jgi:hypothetical protein
MAQGINIVNNSNWNGNNELEAIFNNNINIGKEQLCDHKRVKQHCMPHNDDNDYNRGGCSL